MMPQSLQSRHCGTSHSSPIRHQLPRPIFLNLIDGLKSLLLILVLGKARSYRVPNQGCRGLESPRWFDVSPRTSAEDVMHKQAHCCDEAASHQLPTASAFWIIPIVSTEKCSSLTGNFGADLLLYSLSHFECNGYTVHVLTQRHLPPPLTSTVKSSLFTHAHSSPLSLAARLRRCHANHSHYVNNGWTFSGQTFYTYHPIQR